MNNFETGEWLTYTINVGEAGTYELGIRASNNLSPVRFGWSRWRECARQRAGAGHRRLGPLPVVRQARGDPGAGKHVLKLAFNQQYFNVNRLRISRDRRWRWTDTALSCCSAPGSKAARAAGAERVLQQRLLAGDYRRRDGSSGFSWPFSCSAAALASSSSPTRPDRAGDNHTPASIGQYMFDQIRAGQGRNGSNALYQQISQSGCCGTSPQGGGATQNVLHLLDSNPTDLYISYWISCSPDLVQKMGSSGWRAIFEIKTSQPVDFRYLVQVRTSGGTPFFFVYADTFVPNNNELWNVNVPPQQVPVVIGEWFKFEVYWHRSSGSDGRFWAAVNGQLLDDHSGPNIGVNGLPMDRIMITNLYSSSSYPIHQWVDDLQIWSTFPSAVPGDAWYDPPYAPH